MGLFSPAAIIAAIRRMLSIVGISALAGVLVAGLALPVAAGLGLTARTGAKAFTEMTDAVEITPLAVRSRMVDSEGRTVARFYEENRVYVTIDKIAPVMIDATLAIEDHRFFEHGPLDLQGTTRALISNLEAGETVGGGSTLTQQYVKLVLLDQAETPEERAAVLADSGPEGYMRKLRELRMAVNVEREYSKDEIIERYLNIANFGGPSGRANYGVEAAARYYFSTSAADLTLTQAATLAGLVQRPSSYEPTNNPEAAIGRRNTVITRMAEVDMITESEAADARQADLGLDITETPSGCVSSWAPWFCDYAFAEVLEMEELGETRAEREQLLMRGGLTIKTTLDRDIQRAADKAMSEQIAPADSAIGTMATVEPSTGNIKALANSRKYGPEGEGYSMVNYAVDKKYGNSNGIQAGSAFKPWVLAAAIKQGIPLNLRINAPNQINMTGKRFKACHPDYSRYTVKETWRPQNSTRGGNITLRQATEWSTNTYFVQLLQRTGICEPATIAQKAGIWKQVPNTTEPQPLDQVASFTLGSNTVSPLAMAGGYGMFANRGKYCKSHAVFEVVDRDGNSIAKREPDCTRVLDKGVADGVNGVLQGVIETPGATGNRMRLDDNRPAAGKTGTTNDSIAVWFVGYTPQLSTAVAVADLEGRQTTLDGRTYNGTRIPFACGGCIPGPIWTDMMNAALDGESKEKFKRPDPKIVRGVDERIPDVRGASADTATAQLQDAGFDSHIAGEVASALTAGVVVSTEPSGGTLFASGGSVGLYISTGVPPADDEDKDEDDDPPDET
ncbi:MAG TPA: transglycosylase domain-containing protein [Jiangellaceae bacterium]|nr:transglycosylase domain-containing protein [Jiangellaceae bacterium]